MISFNTLIIAALAATANAYWLMGIEDFITTERIDPIVNPGKISGHVHSVLGGSNFRFSTNTASLRESECTSIPIPQDKSNYWFPHLYFQWANGSFTSLDGGAVIYYLFSDTPGTTTAFPDDFRMLSGDPTLRTYDASSYAQQAVTFLCLDFNGVSTKYNRLPPTSCPSGIRAQINFPSCWDGKNTDSADHKSHVAFLSGGPDSGTCSDPNFPVTLPRIFIEVYWSSNSFDQFRSQAMNTTQPFVYAYGDRTGYGYHADFINGWDKGVLQNAVDKCHCNPYGDPTCCVDQGIFNMNQGQSCRITKAINEQTTGTLPKLPGNNPVQPEGQRAVMAAATYTPALISPVYAYTGASPTQTGQVVGNAVTNAATTATATPSGGNLAVISSGSASSSGAAASSSTAAAAASSATGAASSAAPVTSTAAASSATGAASSAAAPATSAAAPASSGAAPATSAAAPATSAAAPATSGAAPATSAAAPATSAAAPATSGAAPATSAAAPVTSGAAAASSAAAPATSAAAAASSAVAPPPVAPASSAAAGAASSAAGAPAVSHVAPATPSSSLVHSNPMSIPVNPPAASPSASSVASNGSHPSLGSGSSPHGHSHSGAGTCRPKKKPAAKHTREEERQQRKRMHRARTFSHDTHARAL